MAVHVQFRGWPAAWNGRGPMTSDRPGRLTGEEQKEAVMSKIVAGITISVDGYVTGPDDGPGCGLGVGGERLHNWVMGGPWTYEGEHAFAMSEEDRAFYDGYVANIGSGVVGRGMYDASGAWGGTNPFGGTLFVLTHRTADQPAAESGFRFVSDLDTAFAQAAEAAGDGDVAVGGGADVIRQALAAGKVDELGHLDGSGDPRCG